MSTTEFTTTHPEDSPSGSHETPEAVRPAVVAAGRASRDDVARLFARVPGRPEDQALRAAAKRALDVVVSAVVLLLSVPVFLAVALAIKLDSPGPVFYRARRVGRYGRPMAMLKFRKMSQHAEGLRLTTDDDHRFTRIGGWLARTKLDELPQLWNVLRGDMSLIGPRPEDPMFVELHADDYREILQVRPGVTGLSQLAFAEESRILDDDDPVGHYLRRILPQKIALDRLYAREHRLSVDLRIIFWTAVAVLVRRPVAVHRGTGAMNLRRRPAQALRTRPGLVGAPALALEEPGGDGGVAGG